MLHFSFVKIDVSTRSPVWPVDTGAALALGWWLEAHREDDFTAASVYLQQADLHYTVDEGNTGDIFFITASTTSSLIIYMVRE